MAGAAQTGAIGLSVKLPFATPEDLAQKYGINITRGGIYLRSRMVKPPGTAVTLDLKLQGGQRVIYASAVVDFVTGQRGEGVPGMGLRFLTLDPESRQFIETHVAPLPHSGSDRALIHHQKRVSKEPVLPGQSWPSMVFVQKYTQRLSASRAPQHFVVAESVTYYRLWLGLSFRRRRTSLMCWRVKGFC